MSAGEVRAVSKPHVDGAYWLPPTSIGNGLTATAWAPLADLSPTTAGDFVTACRSAHVAAVMAPRDGSPHRGSVAVYRIWVDSLHVSVAEDVLRAVIAECRDRRGTGSR